MTKMKVGENAKKLACLALMKDTLCSCCVFLPTAPADCSCLQPKFADQSVQI